MDVQPMVYSMFYQQMWQTDLVFHLGILYFFEDNKQIPVQLSDSSL